MTVAADLHKSQAPQYFAATVSYPQRDVFIKRGGLDWIPAIVDLRRPHYQLSSRCRLIAGLFRFFNLIQSREGPTGTAPCWAR